MNKAIFNPILRVLAVMLFLFVAGCSGKSGTDEAGTGGRPGGAPAERERVARVVTETAEMKPIQLIKQYVGEIKPYYSVDIRSTGSGWLTSISVDTGDRVIRNAVICVIEHEDIQAQADQAQANISVARASVARAEAELENVTLETSRSRTLFEKGYISKRDLEQADTAEKQAAASLAAAEGQLAQAEAQLKNIQVRLKDSTVRAPFSGVVADRFVDPGAYVSPSTMILRLVEDSSVKAVVNVVEEDFPYIRENAGAKITLDSYPGRVFDGNIKRVSPAIDTLSRTAPIEVLIPNENHILRSGMTARVNLVISENPEAVVIPEGALRRDVESETDFVFTILEGTAKRLTVETGIMSHGEIEVRSGLEPGTKVIVGDTRINDGMKVEVMQREGESR